MKPKNENDIFNGIKAPLEGIDRSKLPGFLKYFKTRPFHFAELFGSVYSEKIAIETFKRVTK